MGMDKMTLKLKTATSLVVSALLGSPTAEAFAPSFAIRELNMAATATACTGMAHNIGSDRSSSSIGSSMSGASSSISSSISGSIILSSSSMSGSNTISSSSSSMTGSSMTGSSMTGSSSSMSGDCTTISAASGTLGALQMSRDGRKRSASPYSTKTSTTTSNSSSSQPSMTLSFRVDADMCIADSDTSGGSMEPHAEPLIPPEPGGVSMSGEVEPFPELSPWACADDRPWRKRARHARRVAELGIEGYGWEAKEEEEERVEAGGEGGEGVVDDRVVGVVGRQRGGERRRRASEKTEVKASRKKCAGKALRRNAMPIMDLVGVTAPLFLIVGISIVQNGPGP